MREKYFIGLDIGTDSVGYAVTNEQYELCKFKGEPMWGVHLFEEASLNDERRAFRTSRRRLDRRQQRVKLIQEIFAEPIAKVEPNFYKRIKESAWCDNPNDRYTLFCDNNYTDADYHKQYPTIHHLISDLIHNSSPHDVRLVYLACAWLVAHRGHFLSEVSKDNIDELLSVQKCYNDLMDYFEVKPWECDAIKFGEILKKRISVTAKYKELCAILFNSPKVPKTEYVDSEAHYSIEYILKFLCGGKVACKDLFDNTDYIDIPSFSLDKADDELAEILISLGDDSELILLMKNLYDWSILSDILSGKQYISDKKVEIYNNHKNDLRTLKDLVKKYVPKKYNECFRDESKGYALYSKSGKAEDFSKYIKHIFKDVAVDEKDLLKFNDMFARLEINAFCPKQVNSDNRVIPQQVYWVELKKILDNASQYISFLNETDNNGYVVKDKILSVFEFKIPYFVGPLNQNSNFSWLKRKAEGKIFPWNFEQLVDFEASEQAFINRMTNTCTYLPYADVLPKCSLLYQKFQVLNEINTLTVNGVRIPVEVKQQIFNELFKSRKKVTKKSIKDFLQRNNFYSQEDLETLGGIDDTLKSSLSSYISFKRFIENGLLSEEQVENIITRGTYTEEKKRFGKWLNEQFDFLSEDDKKYISNLNFKDFARLSKELLCEIYEMPNAETGEVMSIIERMWEENINLMELLSERYTYRDEIVKQSENYYLEHPKSLDERMKKMCISNAVKRPIFRTLDIVSDIVKANDSHPKKIFIEMARGGKEEDKGKRTKSRYQQLKELYAKCDREDVRELEARLDAMGDSRDGRLQSEKLFLYFLQLGKSMYSETPIDLERLGDSKLYDVDHIYPQSKVKDDSVLNNKVLVLSEENGLKSDKYPIDAEIRHKMHSWWKFLLDNGFITREKYNRLTRRTPFDENEEWGFINRQLVETRQSTKAVSVLLKEKYPNTEIVYVKAGLVSEFRQEFNMLKSRVVNDLHHAKDAYLNVVVGNVYNEQFTRKWFMQNRDSYNLKISTLFSRRVTAGERLIWNGNESIGKVKSIVHNKNSVHLTKYAFCRKGGFFDQQPVTADAGLIPLKKGLSTKKYGGYNKPTASFFILTKYIVGKKTEIIVLPIELLYAKQFLQDDLFAIGYAKEAVSKIIGKSVESVSFPIGLRPVKVNTMLELDGVRMTINGKSGGGKCIIFSLLEPLILGYEWEKYIKHIERFVEKKKETFNMVYSLKYDKISPEDNIKLYDLLTSKLQNNVYTKRPANPASILCNGREKFVKAEIFEQSKCLLQILSVFGRGAGGCDLQLLGGGSKAASTGNFSSSLSNWKKNYSDVRMIDSSASGLYEKRSENLLKLL